MLKLKTGSKMRDDAAFIFFVIIGVVLIMILVNLPKHKENMELCRRRTELSFSVIELEEENRRLEREIYALKTDKHYIEAVARKKFLLVKPGEAIVVGVSDRR